MTDNYMEKPLSLRLWCSVAHESRKGLTGSGLYGWATEWAQHHIIVTDGDPLPHSQTECPADGCRGTIVSKPPSR